MIDKEIKGQEEKVNWQILEMLKTVIINMSNSLQKSQNTMIVTIYSEIH